MASPGSAPAAAAAAAAAAPLALAPSLSRASTADDVLAAFGVPVAATAAATATAAAAASATPLLLAGRIVIVTGASTGIGHVAARGLLRAGATVIAAVLPHEADATLAALKEVAPETAEVLKLDLNDLASVRAAAATFLASGRPLHLLVNNAGVMGLPLGASKQGYERQFAINYFGHWVFTEALLPTLQAGAPSRVVGTSSIGHVLLAPPGGVDWAAFGTPAADLKRTYDPLEAYGGSKLLVAMHLAELQRRSDAAGWGIATASVHPGSVKGTQIAFGAQLRTHLRIALKPRMWQTMRGLKTPEQGAATIVAAAVVPTLPEAGGYYSDCALVPHGDKHLSPLVHDAAAGARLWDATAALAQKPQ